MGHVILDVSLMSVSCRFYFRLFVAPFFFTIAAAATVSRGLLHGWTACRASDCDYSLYRNVTLPTTALSVLLEHGTFQHLNITLDNLYFGTNLERLPDISQVGPKYYTFKYAIDISAGRDQEHQTLCFEGVNYRTESWFNGQRLHDNVPGMFLRRRYNVTGGGRFEMVVFPPDHAGQPVPGQQSGDHSLAMDGAVPQYMLGWDWCK